MVLLAGLETETYFEVAAVVTTLILLGFLEYALAPLATEDVPDKVRGLGAWPDAELVCRDVGQRPCAGDRSAFPSDPVTCPRSSVSCAATRCGPAQWACPVSPPVTRA